MLQPKPFTAKLAETAKKLSEFNSFGILAALAVRFSE